jgi:hypothetical protein
MAAVPDPLRKLNDSSDLRKIECRPCDRSGRRRSSELLEVRSPLLEECPPLRRDGRRIPTVDLVQFQNVTKVQAG